MVVAAALAAWPAWRGIDESAAARLHGGGPHGGAPAGVVAVTLDRDDPRAAAELARRARAAGAVRVVEPRELVARSDGVPAPYREVDGRELLRGRVPDGLLGGAIVVIDTADRARVRAAASSRAPIAWSPSRAIARIGCAAVAALLALIAAVAVSRLAPRRAGLAIGAAALVALAAAAIAARASGVAIPAVELAAAPAIGLAGGWIDGGIALRRAVRAAAAPILRATTDAARASRHPLAPEVVELLAELFGAQGLLILERRPGATRLVATHGFRLRASDLARGAPLDPRRPPYRDDGVLRPRDGAALLADPAPSLLLPLVHAGAVEGWLLVTGERVAGATQAHPTALQAVTASIARSLRMSARSLDGSRGAARADQHGVLGDAMRLVDAASTLDVCALSIATAAGAAETALLLATPSGATVWKNARLDVALAAISPGLTGDLGRVLALARRPGERSAGALERVLDADSTVRVRLPERNLALALTPLRPIPTAPATGLLVELATISDPDAMSLPAVSARAAAPASVPALALADTAVLSQGLPR
jgi:hypothetical protein